MTADQPPHGDLLDLVGHLRAQLVACDFLDVLRLTGELGPAPGRPDERVLWREALYTRSVAHLNLGRFEEAARACLVVLESAAADDDQQARIQVLGPGIAAAYFCGDTELALRRLDLVLTAAEDMAPGPERVQTFVAAAAGAGTIGLTELSDQLMRQVVEQVAAGPEGIIRPGARLFLDGMMMARRCQLAIAYEQQGSARAAELYRSVADLCRAAVPGIDRIRPEPGQPLDRAVALYLSHLCLARIALGERDAVREVVRAVPVTGEIELFESITATIEVVWGLCGLRLALADEPDPANAENTELAGRLVELGGRSQLLSLHAETLRMRLLLALERNEPVFTALARERFEAALAELDWRTRLQRMGFSNFRSRTMREIADSLDGASR